VDGAHSKEVVEYEKAEGYRLGLVKVGERLREANYLVAVRTWSTRDTNRVFAVVRDVSELGHGGEDESDAGDGRGGAHDEPIEPGLIRGTGKTGRGEANQVNCPGGQTVPSIPLLASTSSP